MQIFTEVEFDAAHRLSFHEGKCANLHGHRWKVEIMLGKEPFENMVVDFGDVKECIKDEFDHKVLVYIGDYRLLEATERFERTVLDFETTAENIAEYIKKKLFAKFFAREKPETLVGIEVTVYETPNNFARC